jgi:hypothetical protein
VTVAHFSCESKRCRLVDRELSTSRAGRRDAANAQRLLDEGDDPGMCGLGDRVAGRALVKACIGERQKRRGVLQPPVDRSEQRKPVDGIARVGAVGQLGVRDDEAARLAEGAGLKVVMNRFPKIELFRPLWEPHLKPAI